MFSIKFKVKRKWNYQVFIWWHIEIIICISDIKQYLSFHLWFISLTVIASKSIHVANGKVVFFNNWVVLHCIYVPHLYSSVDEHLSCIHILAIVSNAAINLRLYVFFLIIFFSWYIHTLEKAMATHSSTLAWKIPWTEEPGRLQSMGSWRVRHDWSDLVAYTYSGVGKIPWRRERLPTPVFWLGESHGLYSPWGCKELDMSETYMIFPFKLWDVETYLFVSCHGTQVIFLKKCHLGLKHSWKMSYCLAR